MRLFHYFAYLWYTLRGDRLCRPRLFAALPKSFTRARPLVFLGYFHRNLWFEIFYRRSFHYTAVKCYYQELWMIFYLYYQWLIRLKRLLLPIFFPVSLVSVIFFKPNIGYCRVNMLFYIYIYSRIILLTSAQL